MKSYYSNKSGNSKIILYAVLAAIIAGICFVVVQDITLPAEHVSQTVEVNLKK
ncbi:MAG: hypothetical protein IJ770_02835 [Alphaproteobacteria bacterium]|nr:hypothetical protein [Alphaproteobacteria bacterium]